MAFRFSRRVSSQPKRRRLLLEPLEDRNLLSGPGDIEWLRQFGSLSAGQEIARAVGADGSVYVAGETDGVFPGQTGAGDDDVFVRKYDAGGNEQWTRQFGTASRDEVRSVAVDASGIYVAGSTRGALPGQTSAGSDDVFLRKYDHSGVELWTRQFGSNVFELVGSIAVDDSGVYVAGTTGGTLPGQVATSLGDAFLRKYDASGTELWTRQYGTANVDVARGVALDSTGIYVAGFRSDPFSFGFTDPVLRKFDADGNVLWHRQYVTPGRDYFQGIAADDSGVYMHAEVSDVFGNTSVFLRRYDASGAGGLEQRSTEFDRQHGRERLGHLRGRRHRSGWPISGPDRRRGK